MGKSSIARMASATLLLLCDVEHSIVQLQHDILARKTLDTGGHPEAHNGPSACACVKCLQVVRAKIRRERRARAKLATEMRRTIERPCESRLKARPSTVLPQR